MGAAHNKDTAPVPEVLEDGLADEREIEMKHKVLIFRTECAEVEINAPSARRAREIMKERIEAAGCIADLDLEWDQDGGITIDTVAEGSGSLAMDA